MLDDGYITQDQYNDAKQTGMPHINESQTKQVYAGTNGYLLQMVRSELEDKAKISPEQIDTGGFKIVTTINQKDQEAAVNRGRTPCLEAPRRTCARHWCPSTRRRAVCWRSTGVMTI